MYAFFFALSLLSPFLKCHLTVIVVHVFYVKMIYTIGIVETTKYIQKRITLAQY